MKRYVIVDWESRTIERETFETAQEAWRAQVSLARASERSPDEWDCAEIEVEPR